MMYPPSTTIRLILTVMFLLVTSTGVASEQTGLRVVVSIKPLHSIVAGLMRGVEGPELLIDDDTLPYDYQPDADDRKRLAESDLLFWVGPELEPGLAETLSALKSRRLQTIAFLDHQHLKILPSRANPDRRDPMFWLDNRNLLILLDDITLLLEERDPKRAHVYQRNRREVLARLSRIDREYEYGYRGMKAGLERSHQRQ